MGLAYITETIRQQSRADYRIFTALRLASIILLLWAQARHPSGYYTVLRFVVSATGAYGAYLSHLAGRKGWLLILSAMVVLFNPVIPIYLKKSQWTVFDQVTAGILLVSFFTWRQRHAN